MDDQFVKDLRGALNHLYDPDYLRRSPLAALFGVATRADTPLSMQHILEDAIAALKPKAGEPAQSPGRRIYDLLSFRYVEQFNQKEVADQLGTSLRQYRRDQEAALNFLALRLWEKYQPDLSMGGKKLEQELPAPADLAETGKDELAWLASPSPESSTHLAQILETVLDLVHPLSLRYSTDIAVETPQDLPALAAHPVAVRHILLNLLGVAIHRTARGRIAISSKILPGGVEVQMQGSRSAAPAATEADNDRDNLDMAAQLVQRCGGRLTLVSEAPAFKAILVLPAIERLTILAVDDSVDTVQLLERYTSGTHYQLISTHNPEQCLELAEKQRVRAVILDLMMPQVDGWEVLGRLRNNPPTARVPVIVCSILHQEELALTLGADAFLRKPITRASFLATLDRVVAEKGSIAHSSSE